MLSILDVRGGPGYGSTISMLHPFRVALFKYWKILKMNERQKTENTTKKATLHPVPWTCFTFILISFNAFLSLYCFEWLIMWKGTNLLFWWKRICLPRLENFKNRMRNSGCELKCISPRHKILSKSCSYFNYDIENEWTPEKYTRVGITLF